MNASNCSSSSKSLLRRKLSWSVSETVTVPALVVVLRRVPVLVVSDCTVLVVVVPVCVADVILLVTKVVE